MKPTAHDAAAVSEDMKDIIAVIESVADHLEDEGWHYNAEKLRNAIDRLIILDNAAQARQPATDPRVLTGEPEVVRMLLESGVP